MKENHSITTDEMEGSKQSICLRERMKIKFALLDKEQSYLTRVLSALESKFYDKLEIYCFTDEEKAINAVIQNNIDVFFASHIFDIELHQIPERCGFAYLVDTKDVDRYNGERAVCKFQKLESFYGNIVDIYTDKNDVLLTTNAVDDNVPLYVFTSASGGTGTSVAAAAFAVSMTMEGKKTLYINLENFGDTDFCFAGEGQYDMRDMMIALKSGKSNVVMKMESIARKDKTGVYFIATPQNALDVGTLTADDVKQMLELFRKSGMFDCVVADVNLAFGERELLLFKQARSIVFVSDASETSNSKFNRAYTALSILEQKENSGFTGRISVFYSKVSGKLSAGVSVPGIRIIGAAPRFDRASNDTMAKKIAELNVFRELINS